MTKKKATRVGWPFLLCAGLRFEDRYDWTESVATRRLGRLSCKRAIGVCRERDVITMSGMIRTPKRVEPLLL